MPHTMSTQHPDNANVPSWSNGDVIDGNVEILEAYLAYSTLGCQEVMWDAEGKDVDTRVVRKLLQNHQEYFEHEVLGKDIFLTYRIPNPKIEVVEKKVTVETLQNIPVAYDVASSFYKREIAPVFEVVLPFTTESKELLWLSNYYRNTIAADDEAKLDESTNVKDWLGAFNPKRIEVIPLVEDLNSITSVDTIITPYIETMKPKTMRVFIARSDPALNYGLFCAVLLSKIALSKLCNLGKAKNVQIHPIIGAGSKPFRGHLSPENIENFLSEYRGVSTVTIQSAFRYDYPTQQVKESIHILNQKLPNGEPTSITSEEEQVLNHMLPKCRKRYEMVIEQLAPLINRVSAHIPQRRARKLHIGLFGYSRNVAGVNLPRAIPFSAAFYSLGIPAEFLGAKVLSDLSEKEWKTASKLYVNLKHDLETAGVLVSWENLNILREASQITSKISGMTGSNLRTALTMVQEDLSVIEEKLGTRLGPKTLTQKRHENFANNFLIAFIEGADDEARKSLVEAAQLRRCLG